MTDTFRADLVRPVHELLARHAADRPGQVAFRDARRSVTYADLDRRTARVAGHLVSLGLARGARAAICLPNRVETVESHLAVARAGAVGVPLDPQATDTELGRLLQDCDARLVVTEAGQLPRMRRVLAERPHTVVVVVGDAEDAGELPHYETLASTWSLRDPPRDDLGLDEPAWILYTAGADGRPRGVVRTQRTSLWATAACTAPLLGLCPQDRVLWPVPLFHCAAQNLCVLGVTAVGATARLTDGPGAREVLRAAREEDATFLVGVPATYHRLVEGVRAGDAPPAGLRVCVAVGPPCPEPLHEAFRATFGLPLLDGYGSTETGGPVTATLPHEPRVPGSCGVPLPGLTLRLIDPRTGAEATPGEEGEVWVDSPALMLGYHNRPEATEAVLSDGWYRTGDLARQDAAGRLTLTGRLREVIVRGGETVHPGEVEKVVRRVPGVVDAGVCGRPDEALGEVPVAYLVPGPDGVDVDAVLAACREELAPHQRPEELHAVDEVPRDRMGGIARQRLPDLTGRPLWRRARTRAPAPARSRGAADLGLADAGHPLLAAVFEHPEADEVWLTGRLAAAGAGPWLLRRAGGRAVVPSTVLLELALHAAGRLDCARLLRFDAGVPLVLPEDGGVQVRVAVGAPDARGVRPVTVYGREEADGTPGRPWRRHAAGTAAPCAGPPSGALPAVWPPAGARRVPTGELLRAGAVTSVLRGVWRRDGDLFAEVAVDEPAAGHGPRFRLHPALLDAVLRPELWRPAAAADGRDAPGGPAARSALWLPVVWTAVTLHAAGSRLLRVRLGSTPDGTRCLDAVNECGDRVLTAASVRCAPVSAGAGSTAARRERDLGRVWDEVLRPPRAPVDGRERDVAGRIGREPVVRH
ncbi:AMP-binding protein [Streptomyces sp. NPDC052701]|uniref:AMP-binding protein n=1 Tax=Streptomyces sp. NPDC052701 TaxID=3155533 RepID=UPI0034430464